MKKFLPVLAVALFTLAFPERLFAANTPKTLRLKTNFNIWNVNLAKAGWVSAGTAFSWNGLEVRLPDTLPGDLREKTLSHLNRAETQQIDAEAVKRYLEKVAAPELNRAAQDATLSLDDKGKVKFEGFALNGQGIDLEQAVHVIREALHANVDDVRLPLKVIPAKVTVLSEELKQKGIASLISTGESDFSRSPANRRNNIRVGLAAFNGKLIAPDEESGAGKILGNVDGSTGYLPELVIKGDKTIPEYGGGLCQVSTTVYRSLLLGGFQITARRNHSYAVSYYDPQGLDATIYPPAVDMKFKNDSSGYILLQTTIVGNKAYANVYGTPVDRQVDLLGPWYYAYTGIPKPRVEYSEQLAPGQVKKLGDAHGGFKASWYRRITYNTPVAPGSPEKKDSMEHIFSSYEARPLYTVIGVAPGTTTAATTSGLTALEAP